MQAENVLDFESAVREPSDIAALGWGAGSCLFSWAGVPRPMVKRRTSRGRRRSRLEIGVCQLRTSHDRKENVYIDEHFFFFFHWKSGGLRWTVARSLGRGWGNTVNCERCRPMTACGFPALWTHRPEPPARPERMGQGVPTGPTTDEDEPDRERTNTPELIVLFGLFGID